MNEEKTTASVQSRVLNDKRFRHAVLELAQTAEKFARRDDDDMAQTLLMVARVLLEEERGLTSDLSARVLMSEGVLRQMQGRLTSCKALHERACDVSARALGERHVFTLGCLGTYGQLLLQLGDESGKEKLQAVLDLLPLAQTDDRYGEDYRGRLIHHFSDVFAHAEEVLLIGRVNAASRVRG